MAEVINLRQARKQRARSVADRAATENRSKYGQTKGEKARQSFENAQRTKLLDGAKREPDDI